MFDFGNNVNVNVAWCLCGYCVPMSTHIEFVCCLEKAGLPDRADRGMHELRLTKTSVNDTMLGISVCCLCAICVHTRSFDQSR